MIYSLAELREGREKERKRERREERKKSVSFPMLNITYHSSRETASNLAGPVRTQVNNIHSSMDPFISLLMLQQAQSICGILKAHHGEEA